MCHQCNYKDLLNGSGLAVTGNRMRVLEVIGNNSYPLPARAIWTILKRNTAVDRTTVYRILELLVEHEVVERITTGGRAFYYGLAPNAHHRHHPHFYCKICGQMDCLSPESMTLDTGQLQKTLPGRMEKVEIRVDGICIHCMSRP